MNNRKFKILLGIVLVVVLALASTLVACQKESGVTGISITAATPPRATYVQGQALDLSVGTITVMLDGEPFKMPLNAEGVTISGYDSSVLGKQTVTVTYKEKTTTFEVNVVARVVAEEYETSYFVGDDFNASKGRLKLTKDDGNVVTISLNNPSVQVRTFNSTVSGETEVVVVYNDSTSGEHEVKFKVNIYDMGEVSFTGPTKTAYWSHDTELSLDGGYLTIKASGNNALSKFVELTSVEFSGFDPSKATKENTTKPLVQVVTFTFAGKTFEHKISITYSPMSFVTGAAKELSGIDFTQENVTITEEQGKLAMEAVSEYLGLTQAKKNQISAEDVEAIARPAAMYVMQSFKAEAEKFSATFQIDDKGQIVLMGGTYEQMKDVVTALSDSNAAFNTYASLLRKMDEEFKNVVYSGATKISDYIVVMTLDEQGFYLDAFECLTQLHEVLAVVPANWTVDMLGQYADNISEAVYLITSSSMAGYEHTDVLDIVRGWRENRDYFDIIYAYYCYVANGGHDVIVKSLWLKLPPPNALREWYTYFFNALYLVQDMDTNAATSAYLADTTNFMYYYYKTLEASERILSGNDQFAIDLHNIIALDKYVDSNLYKATGGYLYQAGSMLSSEAFENAWKKYLVLVELSGKGALNPDLQAKEFEAMFDAVSSLSPSELFGFLSSLHCLYVREGGKFYAFDYTKGYKNTLVACIAAYYEYKLPQNAKAAVQPLLLAMESYAAYEVFGADVGADEKFIAAIESIVVTLSNLSVDDRAAFDRLLGDCYEKYLSLYLFVKKNQIPDESRYEEQLREICTTIAIFNDVSASLSNTDLTSAEITERLVFMFALYEKTEYLYATLVASEDADLFALLASKEFEIKGVMSTVDMAVYNMRKTFISYGLAYRVTEKDANGNQTSVLLWDAYRKTNIDVFLRDASYLFEHRFVKATIQKTRVDALMEACRALSLQDATILYGIGLNCYYNSLQTFYVNAMTMEYEKKYGESEETNARIKEAVALATALFETEIAFRKYQQSGNAVEQASAFKQKMEKATELYTALAETDIRDSYFKTMYEYYFNLYTDMAE